MTVRRLPETLANRIAAGEVVERPASIVKELVENAIDAGARRVEVIAEGGGTRLVRVTDDGRGMGADDLVLAVERFATSKIGAASDLEAIATLGFRGEALPSIGSVARLDIASRPSGAPHALRLVVSHGSKGEAVPVAGAAGTRIEVTELFARTPARAKFLKSERGEAQAVLDCVRRLAFAKPDVDIVLLLDERRTDFGAGLPLRERLGRIIGAEIAESGIALDAGRGDLHLGGLVAPPALNRSTGAAQLFAVNGRPVRDRQLASALHAAFGDLVPRGRFPAGALSLTVPAGDLDVNVHPAKAEVRFRDPGAVRALIVSGVRRALEEAGPRPSAPAGARVVSMFSPAAPYRPGSAAAQPMRPAALRSAVSAALDAGYWGFAEDAQADFALPPQAERPTPLDEDAAADAHPLGAAKAQLFDTYILAQAADGLVLVDMHAAHERLRYEELKRLRAGSGVPAQALLAPVVVDLDPGAADGVLAELEGLDRLGLLVEPFGRGAVLVRATPSPLGAADPAALIAEIAEALADGARLPIEERLDRILSTVACHGSIRAGRRLRPAEMDALLRQIEAEPAAGTCNHGRPTFVHLSRADLERLFHRR